MGSRLVDRECATDRATTALSTRSTTHLTADLYTCFCGSSMYYTVGARGFEPRTSSVSRNERQAIYQHKRNLTCGVVFVVARHVPVITLCFAGFPRDGILPGPSCSMARMTALPVSTYACSSVAGAFIRPDLFGAGPRARGHAEDVQGRRCRQPGNPGGRRVGFRRRASPAPPALPWSTPRAARS